MGTCPTGIWEPVLSARALRCMEVIVDWRGTWALGIGLVATRPLKKE